jgi:hypothetical protein
MLLKDLMIDLTIKEHFGLRKTRLLESKIYFGPTSDLHHD